MNKPQRRITNSYYNYYLNNFIPLLKSIKSKIKNRNIFAYNNDEELDHVTKVELLRALIYFDKNKNCSLSTWIFERVSGMTKTYADRHFRKMLRSNNCQIANDFNMLASNPLKSSSLSSMETIYLRDILDRLNQSERNILDGYFLQNMTLQELAILNNKSIETIRGQKNKALEHARRILLNG